MTLLKALGLQGVRSEEFGYALLTVSVIPSALFDQFHLRAFLLRGLTADDVAAAHGIYWVWNICNDVFAGYWVDQFRAAYGTRLPLVRCLSLLWILTSALPFLDLGLDPLLHYFTSIMLFDGCVSVVCIARGSLILELGDSERRRVALGRLSTLCAIPEGILTAVGMAVWERPAEFRWLLLVASALSLTFLELGYRLCRPAIRSAVHGSFPHAHPEGNVEEEEEEEELAGQRLHQPCPERPAWRLDKTDKDKDKDKGSDKGKAKSGCAAASHDLATLSTKSFLQILLSQRNFWAFVGMNAVMEMQGTFHSQFNPILVDILTPGWGSWLLPVLGILGFLSAYVATLLADRIGTYHVIRLAILSKAAAAGAAFALGSVAFRGELPNWAALALFVALQVGLSAATKFFDVNIACLADEFSNLAGEKVDVASRLFAAHACVAKPLNSVVAVISTRLLDVQSYRELQARGALESSRELKVQASFLLPAVPLLVACLQHVSWRHFTLGPAGSEPSDREK